MDNVEKFKELFYKSLEKYRNKKFAIAFSGGLDSSVLAKSLKNLGFSFNAYVVGLENSHDVRQARKVASEIGINLIVIKITRKDIEKALPFERKILKDLFDKEKNEKLDPNAIPISINLPFYFIAKHAKEDLILLAQGPDEMLGGYKRHEKMTKNESLKEMKENLNDFLKYGIKQNIATGEYFNKSFEMPFLDKEIIDFCLSLTYDERINQDIKKFLLRQLAEDIGLSHETAYKEKKAAQYGSGIIWEMKKLAKKTGHHISIYIQDLD